jgi:hypothetical protein
VAALLAGFVFAGIIVVLSTKTKQRFYASQTLKLLFVAFFGLAVASYLLSDVAGEQVCAQADTMVAMAGEMLATFAVLMIVSLTWLVVAYDDGYNVLGFLRSLIYVAGGFVILLLSVSSQSYLSAEIIPNGPPAWVNFVMYAIGAVAISIVVAIAVRETLKPDKLKPRTPARWNDDVNRCVRVALVYLAVASVATGVIVGLPEAWYSPLHHGFAYAVAWFTLILPYPVLAFAANALAQAGAGAETPGEDIEAGRATCPPSTDARQSSAN